jgi:hypothetical protein
MNSELKKQILIKMARRSLWGHKLTNLSDLIKLVPGHLRGNGKDAIEELAKEGYLNKVPGNRSEFRYSLALDRKYEIDNIMGEERLKS